MNRSSVSQEASRKRGRGTRLPNVVVSAAVALVFAAQSVHMPVGAAGYGLGISHLPDNMRKKGNRARKGVSGRRLSVGRHMHRRMQGPDSPGIPELLDESPEEVGIQLGISMAGTGKDNSKFTKKSADNDGTGKMGKKGSGKGKGNSDIDDEYYDDDDYGDDGGGSVDDDDSTPTAAPVDSPSSGPPSGPVPAPTTRPTLQVPITTSPTQAPATMSPIEGPPSNREPPTLAPQIPAPTSAPTQPRCPIAGDGLFGSALGISEELKYYYQLQVIPSVTVSEINLNVLNNVERSIGERVLPRVFDQCAGTSAASRSRTNGSRRLRALESAELEGFSTRPRDTVIEEVACVNVEQVYPCFVIRGLVTAYSLQPISDVTIERLFAALRAAVESGQINQSDNRVIAATWRDINADPIPGEGSDGGGSGNGNDDGGGGGNDDGSNGDAPTMAPVISPGGTVPIVRERRGIAGIENWALGLIITGSILVVCMAYLCLRRTKHEPIIDSDDGENDADDNASSSSDHFSDERNNTKEKAPLVVAPPEYEPPRRVEPMPSKPYRDPYTVSPVNTPAQAHPPIDEGSSSGSRSESESGSEFEDEYGLEGKQQFQAQSFDQPYQQASSADQRGPIKQPNDNGRIPPLSGSRHREGAGTFQDTNAQVASAGDAFSAEYSEGEGDEEYEIEYVEDENGVQGANQEYNDDYDDEYDGSYDDDDYEEDSYADDPEEIVVDTPGGTPILPWLAQDD